MLETDYAAFEVAFRRLSSGFSKKWTGAHYRETSRAYFETLQGCALEDVVTAAAALHSRKRWPTAGEWMAAVPASTPARPPDVRLMGASEVDEYLAARNARYRDEGPCACLRCEDAGVSHRPRRYVPDELDDDTYARAFCPTLNRVVMTGHWAHGEELRRWYAARDTFVATARRAGLRRVLALVATREPGQEG